jgi:hypothetical protein
MARKGGPLKVPNEAEYAQMLGRLKDAMDFASEELEQLANGVSPGLSGAVRGRRRQHRFTASKSGS